jgi:hypothetical protein
MYCVAAVFACRLTPSACGSGASLRNICAALSAIMQLPTSTAAVHRCCLDAAVAAAQAELSPNTQQRAAAITDGKNAEAPYIELQAAVADALASAGLLQTVLAAMQRWPDDAELLLLALWYLSAAAASVQVLRQRRSAGRCKQVRNYSLYSSCDNGQVLQARMSLTTVATGEHACAACDFSRCVLVASASLL